MTTVKLPKINENSFTCPHCETLTSMKWLWIIQTKRGLSSQYQSYDICESSAIDFLYKYFPPFVSSSLAIAQCPICKNFTIFVDEKIVFPELKGVKPNEDMPSTAKQIFIEAQDVIGKSPRAACMLLRLCLEELLNETGHTDKPRLVDKINAAAPDGSVLKNVLTATRLTGNKFVHDGTFDSLKACEQTPEQIATTLSTFINFATGQLISIPNQAEALVKALTKS